MRDFGDPVKEVILDLLTGVDPAEDRFVALLTATAAPDDTGATIAEPGYTGYGRVEFLAANWTATTDGVRYSEVDTDFPITDAEVELAGVAILDAATNGALITFENFVETLNIPSGKVPSLASGELAMSSNPS